MEHKLPIFRYYAFDFDDNLRRTPTEIYLRRSSDNSLVTISTEEYGRIKEDLESYGFVSKVNYDEAMINFRITRDDVFEVDFKNSTPAVSWNDFVECVNHASIFAIITARGNSREVFKKMLFEAIINGLDGLDPKMVVNNQKAYMNAIGIDYRNRSDEEIISFYLNLYKHYGMEDGVSSMEVLGVKECHNAGIFKPAALAHFTKYVKEESEKIVNAMNIVGHRLSIGFSDDDTKTVELMVRFLEEKQDVYMDIDFSVYNTSQSKKRVF